MPRFRVYTVGHGGRTVDEIVRQIRAKGIQFVIDVRSVPYSRYQPEFSRKPLARALRDAGLKYDSWDTNWAAARTMSPVMTITM